MANPYIVTNTRELRPEAAEILTGKIIRVRQSKTGEFHFSDYFTKHPLWQTTPGEWNQEDPSGVYTLKTENTLYRLARINNMPDCWAAPPERQEEKTEEEQPVTKVPFTVVDKKTEFKGINYGDGYKKTVFTFSRDITEEEFIEFLKENKYKLHEATGWWDDHSKIEGKGSVWTYTWVLAYTD